MLLNIENSYLASQNFHYHCTKFSGAAKQFFSTGNTDIIEKAENLTEEMHQTASDAARQGELPAAEDVAPFNALSALFPYYNVDPSSLVEENLMPILIEDIFLSEDYAGDGDYDLLPFYDLDNYDLEVDDSFVIYDATSGDEKEEDVESQVPKS